jgi:hypothetical protein
MRAAHALFLAACVVGAGTGRADDAKKDLDLLQGN